MIESNIVENLEECPLCGSAQFKGKVKTLYGYKVCRKCWTAFANKRQIAFAIDAGFIVGVLFSIIAAILGMNNDEDFGLLSFCLVLCFLVKDGFGGSSVGKALLGMRVIDEQNGKSIGFWTSFKRNLPLLPISLIPLGLIIVAVQLCKGHRVGDGWSSSKVIWKKFSDNPIFHAKSSASFIWTPELREAEADKALSKALKVEIKGEWDEAINLYSRVISDYPETHVARDAEISLKSLENRMSTCKEWGEAK